MIKLVKDHMSKTQLKPTDTYEVGIESVGCTPLLLVVDVDVTIGERCLATWH